MSPYPLCPVFVEERQVRYPPTALRLDTSLLSVLASLTGDPAYVSWRNGVQPLRIDSNVDVPFAVYEHAVLCEYAHARLRALDRVETPADCSSLIELPTATPGRHSRRGPS